jgi:dihydrofolate reductase
MIINIIAAMSLNRVIGKDNQLPWHYSEDLQHFKNLTLDHVIVMGYNTYLSIGKPLPKRRNIVLTSKTIDGVETYTSIQAMMDQLMAE